MACSVADTHGRRRACDEPVGRGPPGAGHGRVLAGDDGVVRVSVAVLGAADGVSEWDRRCGEYCLDQLGRKYWGICRTVYDRVSHRQDWQLLGWYLLPCGLGPARRCAGAGPALGATGPG